jgi:hypothetical protein
MNRKLTILALVLLGTGLTGLSHGQSSVEGYDFVQFKHLEPSINPEFLRSAGSDAFGLHGAYTVRRDLQVFARYLDADLESRLALPGVGLESPEDNRLSLGMGYSYLLSPQLDVIASAAYEKLNLHDPLPDGADLSMLRSYDEEGFSLQLGLRGLFTSQLAWDARFTRLDVDRFETGYGFAGHLKFGNGLSFGADVQVFDDITTWTLGGRYHFGD